MAVGTTVARALETVGGRELLEHSYARALDRRYLWREFGESN